MEDDYSATPLPASACKRPNDPARNAAAGFVITRLAPDLPAALALAREQIATGAALGKLEALMQWEAGS